MKTIGSKGASKKGILSFVFLALMISFIGGCGGGGDDSVIARLYRDVRAQTIYAGTTEIMKLIISRNLGFR